MKTGNTLSESPWSASCATPQWSPVMKTGNTRSLGDRQGRPG